MNKYQISKLYIENFKLIDKVEVDLTNENIIVLDGPNGFGKTTIFDAIELVLIGKISRIVNYDKRNVFKTVLFCKDDDKDIVIKVKFESIIDSFTIVKRYSVDKKLANTEKKPDNWELFQTYKLDSFDEPISDDKKITQQEIFHLFDIESLDRYYDLFYYIQQEENTAFFKKTGKDRLERISHLFDTKKEQKESDKVNELCKILTKEKQKILKEIKDTSHNLAQFEKNLQDKSIKENIEFSQLLTGQSFHLEWDQKDIIINSKETRDRYVKDLFEINDFIIHFDDYKKAQFNQKVSKYIHDEKLLENVIITKHFLNDYYKIKKQFEKENKLKEIKDTLGKSSQERNIDNIDFNDIEKIIDIEIDLSDIKERNLVIKKHKKNSSDLSNVVKQLNDTRTNLLKHYKEFTNHTDDTVGGCPLCGYEWSNFETLLREINTKSATFLGFYDDSTMKQTQEIDELYQKHIKRIINWINDYLSNQNNSINESFFRQLEKSIKEIDKIEKFNEWCDENNLDISPYINWNFNQIFDDTDKKVSNLVEYLSRNKKDSPEGYSEYDEIINRFSTLYKDIFKETEEIVETITVDQIKQKKKYIDFLFYNSNSNKIEEIDAQMTYLKNVEVKLTEKIEELKVIRKTYDYEIKQHWNKIMKDIEIPFYIFSGKIIQEYQKGLGIFIEENESGEAKSIKFVSDSKSNHDAVNYLSSGQLSALVISFTLALNKVYGNGSLDMILIDDPVQTMDEINLASLTELLRNEFSHKQIILSTHEDDASRYIRYKFKKYGLNTMRFNLKEDLYIT